jgi:hypothetical protein
VRRHDGYHRDVRIHGLFDQPNEAASCRLQLAEAVDNDEIAALLDRNCN